MEACSFPCVPKKPFGISIPQVNPFSAGTAGKMQAILTFRCCNVLEADLPCTFPNTAFQKSLFSKSNRVRYMALMLILSAVSASDIYRAVICSSVCSERYFKSCLRCFVICFAIGCTSQSANNSQIIIRPYPDFFNIRTDHWNSERLLLTMRFTKEITSSRLYLSYPPSTTCISPLDRWV